MILNTRQLGSTDIHLTELGFGGAPLGGAGSFITDDQVQAIVDAAWDGGVRYFDTAPLYGHGLSEKRLGGALGGRPREQWVLSTKVGRLLVPVAEGGQRDDKMRDQEPFGIRYDYSYEAVRRSLESSFERLRLDRVDILLCHDIDAWTHGADQPDVYRRARDGTLKALAHLREQGVVGAIGLGVNESAVCCDVMDYMDVDCFLLAGRFTLLEQEPLDTMLPKCLASQTSVIIGGPYNSGLLAVTERARARYDYKPAPDHLWQKAEAIRQRCERHGVDRRAAALQYPLRHPAVACVIPGVVSVDEVRTNLDLMHTPLPDALWTDLAAAELIRTW